jgi:hypothetical protein
MPEVSLGGSTSDIVIVILSCVDVDIPGFLGCFYSIKLLS